MNLNELKSKPGATKPEEQTKEQLSALQENSVLAQMKLENALLKQHLVQLGEQSAKHKSELDSALTSVRNLIGNLNQSIEAINAKVKGLSDSNDQLAATISQEVARAQGRTREIEGAYQSLIDRYKGFLDGEAQAMAGTLSKAVQATGRELQSLNERRNWIDLLVGFVGVVFMMWYIMIPVAHWVVSFFK